MSGPVPHVPIGLTTESVSALRRSGAMSSAFAPTRAPIPLQSSAP